jgi:hypothetical protein
LRALPDPHVKPINVALSSVIENICQIVPPRETILVNKHREAYSLYLPEYTFEATNGSATIVPLLDEATSTAQYMLLDMESLSPEARSQVARQYTFVTSFGGSPDSVLISLYSVVTKRLNPR